MLRNWCLVSPPNPVKDIYSHYTTNRIALWEPLEVDFETPFNVFLWVYILILLVTFDPNALASCASYSGTRFFIMSMQGPSSRSNASTSRTEQSRFYNVCASVDCNQHYNGWNSPPLLVSKRTLPLLQHAQCPTMDTWLQQLNKHKVGSVRVTYRLNHITNKIISIFSMVNNHVYQRPEVRIAKFS